MWVLCTDFVMLRWVRHDFIQTASGTVCLESPWVCDAHKAGVNPDSSQSSVCVRPACGCKDPVAFLAPMPPDEALGYRGPHHVAKGMDPRSSLYNLGGVAAALSPATPALLEMIARGLLLLPLVNTPPKTISTRKLDDAVPNRIPDWSTESIGGRLCAVARSSVGSTPASAANVAYQSAVAMSAWLVVPRTRAGKKPPERKLATRTPPSVDNGRQQHKPVSTNWVGGVSVNASAGKRVPSKLENLPPRLHIRLHQTQACVRFQGT